MEMSQKSKKNPKLNPTTRTVHRFGFRFIRFGLIGLIFLKPQTENQIEFGLKPNKPNRIINLVFGLNRINRIPI